MSEAGRRVVGVVLAGGESRRVEAYVTDAFGYDVGSTEKYEKIDNGLIESLLTFVD